jgi:hypothetical protein
MSWLFDAFKFLKGDSTDKVSEEKQQQRIKTCNNCHHQMSIQKNQEVKITGRCDICFCVVSEKTKYKDEKCPINKW